MFRHDNYPDQRPWLGVPFRETTLSEIQESCAKQAQLIADDLRTAGVETPPDREIVAMISYLQKLGKSEPVNPSTPVPPGPVVNR